MQHTPLRKLAVEATVRWFRHGAPTLSAAMAFYTITSLPPLLLIAMGIAGTALGTEDVRDSLVAGIATLTDPATARAVDELLQGVWLTDSSLLVSALAGAAFLFTSTMAFEHVRDSLNRVWETPPKPGIPLLDLLRGRLLAFVLVLATGVVLLVALALRIFISAFAARLAGPSFVGLVVFRGGEILIFLVALSTMFALMFRILPDADPPWHDALLGALLTTTLFLLGEFAIGAYLRTFGIESAYGAVGSMVLLLLWVYYSSMVTLWGAEFTCVYSRDRAERALDETRPNTSPPSIPNGAGPDDPVPAPTTRH